jgi:hypothetical protein
MQWFPLAFCMIVFRHTVGILWTSDQPVSETSTCTGQHNIETQETNIHALSGIRTRDPSNQAAANLRLIKIKTTRHISQYNSYIQSCDRMFILYFN